MAGATTNPTASRLLPWANLGAYVLNILATYLLGTSGVIGKTNSEVSAAYPTLFTPAGYAFAIWGLIFLAEGVFSIYQLLPKVRETAAVQKGVGPCWILMVLLQAGWSLSFAKEKIPLSMVFMVGIFLSLLALVLGLQKTLRKPSLTEYWCIVFPFSLNFGWITAALLANANILAVYHSEDLPTHVATAVCSCAVVGIAAVLGGFQLEDPVFCVVLVWAGTAIAKQLADPVPEISAKFPVFVTDGLSQAAFALVAFAALCALHGLGKTVLGRVRGPGATAETIPPPSPEGMRAASQALLKP